MTNKIQSKKKIKQKKLKKFGKKKPLLLDEA
jgi:hypothetical protein